MSSVLILLGGYLKLGMSPQPRSDAALRGYRPSNSGSYSFGS
jgi:hypothetical protein